MSEQSWQASCTESAELIAAVRRGMYVPHEGLQVGTTVSSSFCFSHGHLFIPHPVVSRLKHVCKGSCVKSTLVSVTGRRFIASAKS